MKCKDCEVDFPRAELNGNDMCVVCQMFEDDDIDTEFDDETDDLIMLEDFLEFDHD